MTGKYFKRVRAKMALSQEELADELGITRQTVIQYEKAPAVPVMAALALRALYEGLRP